jgi:hypothetical protein
MKPGSILIAAVILAAVWASGAAAQETSSRPASSASAPAAQARPRSRPAAQSPPVERPARSRSPKVAPRVSTAMLLWPSLDGTTLAWFGAIVILALTLRLKPVLCTRNLDGIVLAGMCILLALRGATHEPHGSGHSGQWWAYALLSGTAVYWAARGVYVLAGRRLAAPETAVPSGALAVLLAAALAINIVGIALAPVAPGAQAGLVGGLHLADTGKLPYGEMPQADAYGPLHYALYAGALQLPLAHHVSDSQAQEVPMRWANRSEWMQGTWWEDNELPVVRVVNAALLIALVAGVYVLGRQLSSAATALTMVALLAAFVGTLEGLVRPEVMLPGVLLTWTLVCALIPGIGGLLSVLLLVAAGLCWPWAWLGLPALLAWLWRRGVAALLGSVLGLVAGAALAGLGVLAFVQPVLPRADGALALADQPAKYVARLQDDGTLVVDRAAAQVPLANPRVLTRPGWRYLLNAETTDLRRTAAGAAGLAIDWPNGVADDAIRFRDVQAEGDAAPKLQSAYRAAVAALPASARLLVALRTLLEATWMPAQPASAPFKTAWAVWSGTATLENPWLWIRRGSKVAAAMLVFWATLAIFLGRRTRPRSLIGGLLIALAAGLVACEAGPVMNLLWLLPPVLALWALPDESPGVGVMRPSTVAVPPVPVTAGPDSAEPRITVEGRPGTASAT